MSEWHRSLLTCKTTSTIASRGGSSSRCWYLYRRSRTFLMDTRGYLPDNTRVDPSVSTDEGVDCVRGIPGVGVGS